MPDAADIEAIHDEIVAGAQTSRSLRYGSRSEDRRSLEELIKAAEYLAGQSTAVSQRPGLGLRFQQITPIYT